MFEDIKSKVDYRILIHYKNEILKIGTIIVDTYQGDIYYIPSQTIKIIDSSYGGDIEHFSFHRSGVVSVKFKDREREESMSRKNIQSIGYQLMMEDNVFDVASLPKHGKEVDPLDVMFDDINEDAIQFRFSIISGRLIIEPDSLTGVTVSERTVQTDDSLLSVKDMCLGWHSGNADKLMQYALHRCARPEGKSNIIKRTIHIPAEQGITLPNEHMKNQITYNDFEKVDVRVGTIIAVEEFPEARKPAYKLTIDFGDEVGIKHSSAQVTKHYAEDTLVGRQVIGVVNFPSKQIGPFVSETLTLGLADENGDIVLLTPTTKVPNGGKMF